jgi:hypothetical protein
MILPPRRRAEVALAAMVVVGLASPASMTALRQFGGSYARIRAAGGVPQDWRDARGGEYVLPAKVQAANQLFRGYGVETFRYSAGIATDPEPALLQRLAEGTYPVRLDSRARHVLYLSTETIDARCDKVGQAGGVVLAYCR